MMSGESRDEVFWVHLRNEEDVSVWKIRLPQFPSSPHGLKSFRYLRVRCLGGSLAICDLTDEQVPKLWAILGQFLPIIYEFEGESLRTTFWYNHPMNVTSWGEILAGNTLFWNGIVQTIPIPPGGSYSFCPVRREFGFLQYHKVKLCFRTVPLTPSDGTQELWGTPHQVVTTPRVIRHRSLAGTHGMYQRIHPWPFEVHHLGEDVGGAWFDLGPKVDLDDGSPEIGSKFQSDWGPQGPLFRRSHKNPQDLADSESNIFQMLWDRAVPRGKAASVSGWSPLGALLCEDVAYDPVGGRTPWDPSFVAEDWLGGKWRVSGGEWEASLPYGSSSLQVQRNELDLSNPASHPHFKFTV